MRQPVVLRRDHPPLVNQLAGAARSGVVRTLLPGAFALTANAAQPWVRGLAACRLDPNAVILDELAAVMGYDEDHRIGDRIHATGRARRVVRGYRFVERVIPPEWVLQRRGVRFTHPAWTALDLALIEGPRALDEALRLGVPADVLEAALDDQAGRRGARQLREWLAESKDRPFSPAERVAHRALREDGIDGWQGNATIVLPSRTVVIDIAFRRERLAVEVDGYRYHSSRKSFVDDRLRDADLMAADWAVLRVPATTVIDTTSRFLALVRRALERRGRA